MVIVVRLYWVHDFDLVSLCDSRDFNISSGIRDALRAYSRNDRSFRIKLPECPEKVIRANRSVHVYLNPEKEEDVPAIEFLESLRKGIRNSVIKTVFRTYLSDVNTEPCLAGGFTRILVERLPSPGQASGKRILKENIRVPAERLSSNPKKPGVAVSGKDSADIPAQRSGAVKFSDGHLRDNAVNTEKAARSGTYLQDIAGEKPDKKPANAPGEGMLKEESPDGNSETECPDNGYEKYQEPVTEQPENMSGPVQSLFDLVDSEIV